MAGEDLGEEVEEAASPQQLPETMADKWFGQTRTMALLRCTQ